MMWKYIFVCCLLVFSAQSVPAPGHGALKGFCNTNLDCSRNECCVSFIQRRGKRSAERSLPADIEKFVNGKCEKLGKSGSECLVVTSLMTDIYSDNCPCQKKYTCQGTGQIAIPQGELGTCVRNKSTRG